MQDLAEEITEYLIGERQPLERGRLIAFIIADARRISRWRRATIEQWSGAIDQAIERGLIEQVGCVVRPAVKVEKQVEQLELF